MFFYKKKKTELDIHDNINVKYLQVCQTLSITYI